MANVDIGPFIRTAVAAAPSLSPTQTDGLRRLLVPRVPSSPFCASRPPNRADSRRPGDKTISTAVAVTR